MTKVRLRLPLPHQTSPEQLAAIVAPLMGLDQGRLARDWACSGVARSAPLRRDDADLLANVLVSFNVHAEFEAVHPTAPPVGGLEPELVQSGSSTINGMESALLQQALAYLDQRDAEAQRAPPPPSRPTARGVPRPQRRSTAPVRRRAPIIESPAARERPLEIDLLPLTAGEEHDDLKTLVDPPKGLSTPPWAQASPAAGLPAPRRRRVSAPPPAMEHPVRAARQGPPPTSLTSGAHTALAVQTSEVVDRRMTFLFWLLFVASAALGALALLR